MININDLTANELAMIEYQLNYIDASDVLHQHDVMIYDHQSTIDLERLVIERAIKVGNKQLDYTEAKQLSWNANN